MKANYRQIPDLIASYQEFEGNSTSGKIVSYISGLAMGRLYDSRALFDWIAQNPSEKWYTVYSYATPMLVVSLDTGERWINPNKYSNTTSKIQGIIRRAFA